MIIKYFSIYNLITVPFSIRSFPLLKTCLKYLSSLIDINRIVYDSAQCLKIVCFAFLQDMSPLSPFESKRKIKVFYSDSSLIDFGSTVS